MIYNFCKNNPDLQIDGLALQTQVTEMLFQEFLENVILEDKQLARSLIFVVAPLCLRISINVLVLDMKDNISVLCNK
jgi:hypothetical protein